MATLTRNRQFNFRVNEEMLNSAKDVLEKQGMTLSDALNLFVEQIATKQELPIQTEGELRAEAFWLSYNLSWTRGIRM